VFPADRPRVAEWLPDTGTQSSKQGQSDPSEPQQHALNEDVTLRAAEQHTGQSMPEIPLQCCDRRIEDCPKGDGVTSICFRQRYGPLRVGAGGEDGAAFPREIEHEELPRQ